MQQTNKYNRDYLTHLDDYGRCPAVQVGLYAGCLSNYQKIKTFDGHKLISEIPVGIPIKLYSFNFKKQKQEIDTAIRIDSGKKKVFEITTSSGKKIRATNEHIFFTIKNDDVKEIELNKLNVGDRLITE